MKTAYLAALLFLTGSNLFGQQNAEPAQAQNQKPKPTIRDTPPSVVERDANSRVWQGTTYEKLPSGEFIPHLHTYTELATGMHYQKDGQWVESKEEIDIVANGGAAIQGQHQVYFPYDIYSGVIEIVTADGKHLKARPLAISYFDGTNNVMIAQLTNSAGLLVSNNQVIYTNAFTEIDADLLCTYRRSGFECDLVFRSRPPTPEDYGLNSTNTRLELLTEFFDTPEPRQITSQAPEISLQSATALNAPITQVSASIPKIADSTLQFGSMTMIRGKAFAVNIPDGTVSATSSSAPSVAGIPSNVSTFDTPVSKTWTKIEGRTFLIEEVTVATVSAGLQSLPATRSAGNLTFHKVSTSRLLPPSRIAQSSTNRMEMASAAVSRPGVVIDYNIVSSQTNLTFRGDTTYYVSGTVNLYGTNVIEGGAVIKYNTNSDSTLNILGNLECRTGPYHPAIFTSADDDSVGEGTSLSAPPSCTNTFNLYVTDYTTENLSVFVYDDNSTLIVDNEVVYPDSYQVFTFAAGLGQHFTFDAFDEDSNEYYLEFWASQQTGSISAENDPYYGPSAGYFGVGGALCTPPTVASTALSLANGANLNDLIVRNVGTGIQSSGNCSVTNLQFVNCKQAFQMDNTSLYAGNILISGTGKAFGGHGFTVKSEQFTYDNGDYVAYSTSGTSTAALTNAIITRVSNWGLSTTINTNQVFKLTSSSGIYQTVGAGSYYLATNSPYRDIGITNINSALLASMRQKTTYPPIVYTSNTFSTNVEFSPSVARDTDLPDIGYHYSPLDYCFGTVTANSNLTFYPGIAVGYFETFSANGYGIALGNNVTNTFNGTATSPCVFARYDTVQEGGNGNWTSKGNLAGITTVGNTSYVAQIDARFTRFYAVAKDPNHFRDYSAQLNSRANNCEFYSGILLGTRLSLSATNCLFDRVASLGAQTSTSQSLPGLAWRNCTFHGGILTATRSASPYWPVWIENCVFDSSTTNMDDHSGGSTNITYCAYNAFVNGAQKLVITNVHDLVVSNYTWQTGPLGNWYQSPSSSMINTGSVTADLLGLYHFTTQTDQVKETNSVVDIGYHYIALDTLGNVIDTDGDGIPDYLEDATGNGVVDLGESSWLLNSYNGLSFSSGLQVFTPLK
jgi:hypothetical protein